MIPIVWLSTWWLIIPLWADPRGYLLAVQGIATHSGLSSDLGNTLGTFANDIGGPSINGAAYGHWRVPFIYIWLVSVCFGLIAIIRPFVSLHRWMKAQTKAISTRDRPALTERIKQLRARLTTASSVAASAYARMELARTVGYADQVDDLPTWPFDAKTFMLMLCTKAVVILLPLLAYYYGRDYGALSPEKSAILDWLGALVAPIATLIGLFL